MHDKTRKLTLVERINHFKAYNLGDWKKVVAKVKEEGYTQDEAVLEVLNRHNVPTMGRTVVRGTVVVKTL